MSSTLAWAGDPTKRERPAPVGLECFAHWSGVHGGINVELSVPEGLRLTVHVNDHLAVDTVIGDPIPTGWPPETISCPDCLALVKDYDLAQHRSLCHD